MSSILFQDLKENQEEKKDDNKFINYYNKLLPNLEPLALYKNTKFLTLDKLNGGLLNKDEINEVNDDITGYCFDLKDSNYFVLDIDINELFKAKTNLDIENDCNLLNCNLNNLPDSIEIFEFSLIDPNKKKKIKINNIANILFCELFNTPFIKTASKGYHFYFKNDLTNDQLLEIFGINKSKYIKCISLFNNTIDIDIFLDNKLDNDSRLVLPFSKVIIENKDSLNDYKTLQVQYSGLRYYKDFNFNKASNLIKWLKYYINPIKIKEIKENNFDKNKYNERGKVIDVFESDKNLYLNYIKQDFKILSKNLNEISTYRTYPFNLYTLICTIVYFPINMHYDLLKLMITYLSSIMTENCIKEFLNYYYHIYSDEHQKEFWKGPSYLEAIINSKFNSSLNHKYKFIHENDQINQNNSSEEVLDDENLDNPKEIIIKINNEYPKFKLPSKF